MENNIKNLERYVELSEKANGSNIVTEEVIGVEHRHNNPKRDFLFVNKWQGKHIPCYPTEFFYMCNELAKIIASSNQIKGSKNIVTIGFAETATAIGYEVAKQLRSLGLNIKYSTQTTRESKEKIEELLGAEVQQVTFSEEHSHATEQKLLLSTEAIEKLQQADYILFIEDEISTGNTILNCCKQLRRFAPEAKFGVASVCNWQTEECLDKFYTTSSLGKTSSIERFYLIDGKLKDKNMKMGFETDNKAKMLEIKLYEQSTFAKDRIGFKEDELINNDKIDMIVDKIAEEFKDNNKGRIEVIGTEEFMHLPIEVASRIYLKGIAIPLMHSTTRSCIDVYKCNTEQNKEEIRERVEIPSCYDKDRKTYLYNLDRDCNCVFITDGEITEEIVRTIQGFYGNNNVIFITVR